jgi:hypothetical protein
MRPSKLFIVVGVVLALTNITTLQASQHEFLPVRESRIALAQGATPVPTATVTPIAPPVPSSVAVVAQVNPTTLRPGDTGAVNITLSGVPATECLGVPGAPVDTILIIDNSASAGKGDGSKLERAKSLATTLLNQMSPPVYTDPAAAPQKSRAGLITANIGVTGTVVSLVPLNENLSIPRADVNSIDSGADTGLEEGLLRGMDELQKKAQAGRKKSIVLFLHDDGGFTPKAFDAADQVRKAGIEIYVIGLGKESDLTKASVQKITGGTSPTDHYLFEPSPTDLRRTFVQISGGETSVAARKIVVRSDSNPANAINIDPGSISAGGSIQGGQLVWTKDQLNRGDNFPVSYKFQVASTAVNSITFTANVSGLDCNGYLLTTRPAQISLNVGPTATPSISIPAGRSPTVLSPTVNTTTITWSGCPAQSAPSQKLSIMIPPAPTQADIVFAFDVTSSMKNVLQSAANNASRIMTDLAGLLGDVQFAVIGFADYPFAPYGAPGDQPYVLHQRLTNDRASIQKVLSGLSVQNGEDSPEAYTRALYESYSDPNIGWRAGSRRIVIMFGDQMPHDDDLNAGIANPAKNAGGKWTTGLAPSYLDPGRDGTAGTADDLDFQKVLKGMQDQTTTLLFANSGTDSALTDYWKAWASQTGPQGNAVTLANAAELPRTVQSIVAGAVRKIESLKLESDANYQSWFQANPAQYTNLQVPEAGQVQTFDVVLTIPRTIPAGDYRFPLRAVGDGATYNTWNVGILVDVSCFVEPATATPEATPTIISAATVPPVPTTVEPPKYSGTCADFPWWLVPILLALFAAVLWWLINQMRGGPSWLSDKFAMGIRAWLPCILALIFAMALFYLIGEHLIRLFCPVASGLLPIPVPVPLWVWLLLLIPLILFMVLCWLMSQQKVEPPPPPPPIKMSKPLPPPDFVDQFRRPTPTWQPTSALIIGLGGTGRHVLTHLKKNLLDAGGGVWHSQVKLLAIDTNPEEMIDHHPVKVQFAGVELTQDEIITVAEDMRDVIERMRSDSNADPELRNWFPLDDYRQRLTEAQLNVKQNGTAQRRPLGRAVIFRDIQKGQGGSQLWRCILEPLREIYVEGQTQIIIVGSLAGGAGSGMLFDLAYLLRRATRTITRSGVPISAFLVTDTLFAQQSQSPQLKINTMGTLRELGRFLLAKGRPYPMTYRRLDRDALLNGYVEWSLFDDCYIFDGERPGHALTRWLPQYGLFPMMADVITVLLDHLDPNRQQKTRPLMDYRNALRVQIADEQLRRAEPIISSYGAFTYRLPMLDLTAALDARFAKDLLRLFLTGPDYTGENVMLEPQQNREDMGEKPAGLARQMLSRVSPATHLLVQIEGYGWTPALQNRMAATLSSTNVAMEQARFSRELNDWLLRILNGSEFADVVTARAGKLGYTREFLHQLASTIEHAHLQLDLFQPRNPTERNAIESLKQIATEYRQVVEHAETNVIDRTMFLFAPLPPATRPGEAPPPVAVYQQLQRHVEELRQYRKEMAQIVVRRYFADDALLDRLYQDHYAPHLEKCLERFYWRERSDGTVELVLRHWKDIVFTTDATGQVAFAQALLDLAAKAGETIWQERLSTYLDDQDMGEWRSTDLLKRASDIRSWADAPLTFQVGHASTAQQERFLWVNNTVTTSQVFASQVSRGDYGGEVRMLEASDPYAATLLTSLDNIALSVLDCHRRLEEDYKVAHSLSGKAGTGMVRRPEPVQIFAAECNALLYEPRLPELNEPPRLFHPLFVAALENLERARRFAFAYALGWVRKRRDRDGDRYQMRLPSHNQEIWLTRPETSGDSIAPVVLAMQGFVLGHPETDVIQHEFGADALDAALTEELKQIGQAELEQMDRFQQTLPDDLRHEQRVGAKDFISFTRLVVRDYLRWAGERQR